MIEIDSMKGYFCLNFNLVESSREYESIGFLFCPKLNEKTDPLAHYLEYMNVVVDILASCLYRIH